MLIIANTPIQKLQQRCIGLLCILFIFFMPQAMAATYTITSGSYPTCSGSWSVSGTTYTCSGQITLGFGDVLSASTTITVVGNTGFILSGNTIGSASNNINIKANSGSLNTANSNTIYGNVITTSAAINLGSSGQSGWITTVSGSVTSTSGTITSYYTTISGAVSSGAGISLTMGGVTGAVTSGGSVTTSGTNLSSGVTAATGMTISGGAISGAFVMTQDYAASFSSLNLSSGSISGASTVTISNSSIGGVNSTVSVTSTVGAITLNSVSAYGDYTAPSGSTVNVNTSSVVGVCLPNSTPANACIVPTCTTGLIGGLVGSYYNNITLSSPVASTRTDNSINFDWGSGAPSVSGIGSDYFSVSWVGNFRAPSTGNYQFQTLSDDGVRLYVNNVLVIDNWTYHAFTTNTSSNISLTAGQSYPIRLEYFEGGGGAIIKLSWSTPTNTSFVPMGTQSAANPNAASFCTVSAQSCPSGGLLGGAKGKYYNDSGSHLTGSSVTRIDPAVNFNWGTSAPGPAGIGADNFSVHWDGILKVTTTGTYQFQTQSDDGVRLWVNGVQIINNWTGHVITSDTSGAVSLTAGVKYPVVLEYFELSTDAVIQLFWKKPSDTAYAPLDTCPSEVSYYGISHSGTGITCAAEAVTVSAYDSSDALVAPTAGTQITLSTTPNTGTWSTASTYSFNGSETSAVRYLRQLTAGTLNINVTDGTNIESASLDPNIAFVDSGFKFSTISTQTAGILGTSTLQAIRTDNNTGACAARVTGTKNVNLAYVCRNPTSCIAGQTLSAGGTSIASNPNGTPSSYTPVSLTFDGNGTANVPINYSDVGLVKLYASFDVPASGNDPAITLTGSSNDFVVKPYTLAVSNVTTQAGGANPGGTGGAGAASGFISAGTPFKIYVEARNSAGGRTPNFGNETSPTPSENDIKVVAATKVHPTGGSLTALQSATSFSATTPAGTFINSTAYWDQVGSITLQPQLADSNYMGVGDISVLSTSGTVGRFYPDHYTLSGVTLNNSCGSFSYMGQPNTFNYTLTAQGYTGTTLTNYAASTNYSGTLASPSFVAENADAGDGATLSSRVNAGGVTPNWIAGVLTFTSTSASFNRQSSQAPDGPYTSLQWGMDVTDSFDARILSGKNMNPTTSGNCTTANNCSAVALSSPLNLRYGRLRLDDAFGPETVELRVNFNTEYWTGNYFALNTSDSCTKVPRAAITYPAGTLAADANRTVALSGGSTQGTYTSLDASNISFISGTAGQKFTAPSGGGTGSFTVLTDLTNLMWLNYDWNQNAVYSETSLPTANFSFGSYRGNDRIIYWREKLQ